VNADGSRLYITASTGSYTPAADLAVDAETLSVGNRIEVVTGGRGEPQTHVTGRGREP